MCVDGGAVTAAQIADLLATAIALADQLQRAIAALRAAEIVAQAAEIAISDLGPDVQIERIAGLPIR